MDATKLSILRSFVNVGLWREVHHHHVEAFLDRPLECLGGYSLKSMAELDWSVVTAWMKDVVRLKDETSRAFQMNEASTPKTYIAPPMGQGELF